MFGCIKYFLGTITILFSSMLFFTSCDDSIPERTEINERLIITTTQGEVALMEINQLDIDNGETISLGDDKIIIQKNFVAYDVFDNTVFLCEEKDDLQMFWTYDMEAEILNVYNTYSELCDVYAYKNFNWEPLWIAEFHIKQSSFDKI